MNELELTFPFCCGTFSITSGETTGRYTMDKLTTLSQIAKEQQTRYEVLLFQAAQAGQRGENVLPYERKVNQAWKAFEQAQEQVRQQVFSLIAG